MMRIFLCSLDNVPHETLLQLAQRLPAARLAAYGKSGPRTAARTLGYFLASYAVKQLDPTADTARWASAANGKPFFEGSHAQFSLSYAEPLVAVAVSAHCAVGIDIEQIRPRPASFATRWFCAEEAAQILQADDKDAALALLWAKKEAVAKQLATGLGFDLARLDVRQAAATVIQANGIRYALSLAPTTTLPPIEWADPSAFLP